MPYSIKIEIIAYYLCSILYAVMEISSWIFLPLKLVGTELGPALLWCISYHQYDDLNLFFPLRIERKLYIFAKEKNAGEHVEGFSVLSDRVTHSWSLPYHCSNTTPFFRGDLAYDQDSLPELQMCPSPHSCWQGYSKDLQASTLTAACHSKRDKKTFVSGWGKAWNVGGGKKKRFLFLNREVWIVLCSLWEQSRGNNNNHILTFS